MKSLACYLACFCAFGTLHLFAVNEETKPFLDEDVVEQTDVYAIPLDTSADTDEANLAKMKAQEKKAQKKEEATKQQPATVPVVPK